MKASFALSLLVLIVANIHAQIGAKTQQGKIYGRWSNSEFGHEMVLQLNQDGSGELEAEPIKFVLQTGNKLVITQEGERNTYSYVLSGDALTVSGGDLDQPITFKRGGASGQAATQTGASAYSNSAQSLNGTWTGYGETITFNAGQCIYQGQTYPFSTNGNNIVVQTGQGVLTMPYALNENQLTLAVNGQSLTYNKGNASSSANTSSAPVSSGGGNIDLSLVGKWCYVNVTSTNSGGSSTDQCITINANGTYS
jgi:hypothetical protein